MASPNGSQDIQCTVYCLFGCTLRWIAVCLEDGSSATKAGAAQAKLDEDLLLVTVDACGIYSHKKNQFNTEVAWALKHILYYIT